MSFLELVVHRIMRCLTDRFKHAESTVMILSLNISIIERGQPFDSQKILIHRISKVCQKCYEDFICLRIWAKEQASTDLNKTSTNLYSHRVRKAYAIFKMSWKHEFSHLKKIIRAMKMRKINRDLRGRENHFDQDLQIKCKDPGEETHVERNIGNSFSAIFSPSHVLALTNTHSIRLKAFSIWISQPRSLHKIWRCRSKGHSHPFNPNFILSFTARVICLKKCEDSCFLDIFKMA